MGLASVCFHWKSSLQRLSASPAQCLSSLGHPSVSGWPNILYGGETSDNHWLQGWEFLFDLFICPLCSSLCTLILPSLNNQHHFLIYPSFIALSPYTSTVYLWISTGQSFLAFINHITDHGSGILNFCIHSWFQTFAVFWILYVFFWVFPQRQIVVCRRFGTLCQFHLQGLDVKYEVCMKYFTSSPWRWNW